MALPTPAFLPPANTDAGNPNNLRSANQWFAMVALTAPTTAQKVL